MPRSAEASVLKLQEGEGPQRGDLCIFFPPICETEETLDAFLARERPRLHAAAPVLRELPWKHTDREPPLKRRDPDSRVGPLQARAIEEWVHTAGRARSLRVPAP